MCRSGSLASRSAGSNSYERRQLNKLLAGRQREDLSSYPVSTGSVAAFNLRVSSLAWLDVVSEAHSNSPNGLLIRKWLAAS